MQWRHLRNSGLLLAVCLVATTSTVVSPALALTTVQSQVCSDFAAPVIVSPSDGTQTKDDSVMIEGTGEPGKTVAVMKNDAVQGTSAIAADGSFGFTVLLQQGDNTFIARESNECSTIKDSSPVTVHADIPVPVVPPEAGEPLAGEPSVIPSPQITAPGTSTTKQPFVPTPNSPGFQKPTITQPSNGKTVYLDTLLIEGTAYPGSVATIYVNGVGQAQLITPKEGTFKVRVVLREGRNVIKVRSSLSGKTATSDELIVTYVKKVTSTLPRPLTGGEILATGIAAGAAVVGGASIAMGAHWSITRSGFKLRWRK